MVKAAWEEIAAEDIIFFGGVLVLGVGVGINFGLGWGLTAGGSLLVFSVKPIGQWFSWPIKKKD